MAQFQIGLDAWVLPTYWKDEFSLEALDPRMNISYSFFSIDNLIYYFISNFCTYQKNYRIKISYGSTKRSKE